MSSEPEIACAIINGISSVREDEELQDFIVEVEGKEFKCHRLILSACSGFFHGLLRSGMKESLQQRTKIEGVPKESFTAILETIYTGSDNLTRDNMLSVWLAADQLQITIVSDNCVDYIMNNIFNETVISVWKVASLLMHTNIIERCERFLLNNTSLENWEGIYLTATKLGTDLILSHVRDFIKKNYEQIIKSETFLCLSEKDLLEIISSQDLVVSTEDVVTESILYWVNNGRQIRSDSMAEYRIENVSCILDVNEEDGHKQELGEQDRRDPDVREKDRNEQNGLEQDTHEQDAHEQNAHEQDGHENNRNKQVANEQNAHEQVTHEQNGHEQNGHEQDGHEQNGHEQGGCEQDGHEQDAHKQVAHEQNAHEQDEHEQNRHEQDGHEQDGHEQAGHEQDGHEQDGCEQDGCEQDGHEQNEQGGHEQDGQKEDMLQLSQDHLIGITSNTFSNGPNYLNEASMKCLERLLSETRLCLVNSITLERLSRHPLVMDNKLTNEMIMDAALYKSIGRQHGLWTKRAIHRSCSDLENVGVMGCPNGTFWALSFYPTYYCFELPKCPYMKTCISAKLIAYMTDVFAVGDVVENSSFCMFVQNDWHELRKLSGVGWMGVAVEEFIYLINSSNQESKRFDPRLGNSLLEDLICFPTQDNIEHIGSLDLFILAFCSEIVNGVDETAIHCLDTRSQTWTRLDSLEGSAKKLVSFSKEKQLFILQSNGNLWEVNHNEFKSVNLQSVGVLWWGGL